MMKTYTYSVTVRAPNDDEAGDVATDLAEATSAIGYDVGPFELTAVDSQEIAGPKTYHVEVNMTGKRASRDFRNEQTASSACRTLNLEAGPGGKYGVYDNEGKRV